MKVSFKPTSVVKARLGIEPNGRVQKYFVKRVADYMDNYVPIDRGILKKYKIEGNFIIYEQPYAHYMYEGKVMGPNIPIKNQAGNITGWFSPRGKRKTYTGKEINYSKSQARGHTYAGPHWDKRMWTVEKDNIIEELQKLIGGK